MRIAVEGDHSLIVNKDSTLWVSGLNNYGQLGLGDKGGPHELKMNKGGNQYDRHKGHHIEGFKRRFIISSFLTIPILLLTPIIQQFLNLRDVLRFPGENWVLFILSSFIYFNGGWPFLQGLYREIREKLPGMMTLIGLAISVAYVYSTAVSVDLEGDVFFWVLATLIDIMLLGHWICCI